jgi:nitrate/nitrite transporter NarK
MAGLSVLLVTAYPGGLTMELYPLVFLCGALSGCGIATFSVGTTQTSYWYPKDRQGTVLAVCAGLGNSSPGLFTLLLPIALAALGLVVTRTYGTALGATVCLAVGVGIANAAVFQLVPKYVPEAVGGASGLVGGLGAFGGFVVPPILGLFVDSFGESGYPTGFVVVSHSRSSVALAERLYRTRASVGVDAAAAGE